jgi:von Willebrand factor type A domain
MSMDSFFASMATTVTMGCQTESSSTRGTSSDTDTDTDVDTDADSDADADTDTDTDADTDTDTEDCYEQLDIVFVLDVSTTMSFVLDTLKTEIGKVWDAAMQIDDEPHFGLVVFVDDFLVANDGQTYMSSTEIQSDFQKWYQHTQGNTQTHSNKLNTDWPENAIDALFAATSDYTWRDKEKTLRVIILVTDDTFKEAPKKFTSGVQVVHTYAETVARLQEETVRVACFATYLGGSSGTDDVSKGFFKDYLGQPSIPEATSAEVFDVNMVKTGGVSLVDAINDFVLDEQCSEYEPIY